jgi:hypothetical protein
MGGYVGTETNHPFHLITNYTARVTISTSGYAGFGSTTPAARVHISNSNAREALRVYLDGNTTNYLSMWQGTGAGVIDPIGTGVLQLGYDQTTNVTMGVSSTGTNNSAKIGIGTNSPLTKLDVRGDFVLDAGTNPVLYTGTGSGELNRFLLVSNSPGFGSASGLKAGGVLVSDSFAYASPGKNDLIVKGNVGIGATSPQALQVNASLTSESSTGTSNIRIGMLAGTPRIILDHASGTPFEIDNASGRFRIYTPSAERFTITSSGQVGIGTISPDAKLAVKGQIHAEEVKVDLSVPVPDYVFAKDYKLPSLEEIQSYIEANQHLPEVPSAKEMEEKGINVGEMNLLLLKKVEELTLHLITLNKVIIEQGEEIKQLKTESSQSKEK